MIHDLDSKLWRLNHLYRIVGKDGDSIPFKLNSVQESVLSNLHKRNLILKARQLGMSTFAVLWILDEAIFNSNVSCGIVSYSLEHAQYIFKRIIGHALDSMTDLAKQLTGITGRSAREISFSNGSILRVDTTLRGGSYQAVLVSEFGKTCARNPMKAEEVITGTLQAIGQNCVVIIESTGEGNSGFFADMVTASTLRGNDDLSDMEYYLHFFPWYLESGYRINKSILYDATLSEYFTKVENEMGVVLDEKQRNWYANQKNFLADKVRQEFPSTVSEAFLSTNEAFYFQSAIEEAYRGNRCLLTSIYDQLEPVYAAMDIGVNDLTVIVFFQVVHGEIRIIDFYADNNKGVDFYARFMLQEKSYLYHTIFLPHDAAHRDGIVVDNTYERDFKRFFQHTNTRVLVLKKTDKSLNISNAKQKLSRCVFAINRVKTLLDFCSKYRKKWSEAFGKYEDTPFHDISSNYADALIYSLQAVSHIETVSGSKNSLESHKKAVEGRRLLI